jgi:sorting nexin-1/2
MDAKQEFEQCSRLIKSEVARFEQERIEDFKLSLQSFLDGMIASQKRVSTEQTRYLLSANKGSSSSSRLGNRTSKPC